MTTLAALTPLITLIAGERTASAPDLFDDARQEGLIAAWRFLAKRPDAPTALVTHVARRAILDLLAGRHAFGSLPRSCSRDAAGTALALDDAARGSWLTDSTASADMAAAEWAAHRGQLDAALATLHPTDAAFVTRVFVDGHRGRGALPARWTRTIRPHLAAELAHLEGAA